MGKLTLVLISIIVVAATTVGQTNDEYRKLRGWLNVSPGTVVLSSNPSKLPSGTPAKVYLATGKDEAARAYYTRWVEQWNRSEGQRFGLLEVVPDLAQANLIIARLKGDTAVEQRGSIGTVPQIEMNTRPPSSRPTMSTRTQVYRPLYAYLILRTPDALELVYRHVDRSSDASDPDGNLVTALKKKIKQR
jgi:hypothetical protein